MSLPVVLNFTADRDFEAATVWYEQNAGLGERFVERVQDALDQIGRMPELHAAIDKDIRRVRVRSFPFHVLYRIKHDRVEVIAVSHNKRNPKDWQSRT